MKLITLGRTVVVIILSAFALSAGIPAFAQEQARRSRPDRFLSPELSRAFYRIEVQTLSFLDRQRSDINGLVESFRGSSVYAYDIFTRAFVFGQGGVLDCQSFTYDGAVAALCYIAAGRPQVAAGILEAYEKDFPIEKNGMIGLLNCYRTDEPVKPWGLVMGSDGDRIHLGPTMWVAIAALHYTALTGDMRFLPFVLDIVRWARSLSHYRFPDGSSGGASMGSGWGPDWSKVYSLENNVDYYAVLSMLEALQRTGRDDVRRHFFARGLDTEALAHEKAGILRWITEVCYDRQSGSFACGANENGLDRTAALDTVSWTIAALGPDLLKKRGIDPDQLMTYAEKAFRARDLVEQRPIEGFDFTDLHTRKRPGRIIWMEGTGFHAVTYQIMSRYAKRSGRHEQARVYADKSVLYADQLDEVSRLVNMTDLPLPYTSKRPAEKQIIMTFVNEWEIPRGRNGEWVASVSSTGWRYLVMAGFNPLSFEGNDLNYLLFSDNSN